MNAASRDFTVGDLSFRLETDTGLVRSLRFRGHEVLRGIYPAVRGARWETLSPALAPPLIAASAQGVTIHLAARVTSPAGGLHWHAQIVADAQGTLRYHWRGCADREMSTNRAGLCILHPATAAGAPCTVEHVDGRVTTGHFPGAIAPHQPFQDIRAITHAFAPGVTATAHCAGEVFEMEDQRNWTDASFKTYCRPLDWPAPYELRAGSVVEHTVTVTVHGIPTFPANAPDASCAPVSPNLSVSSALAVWPRIGFGLRRPLPPALRDRARRLRPAHVRVETTHASLAATLAWAKAEADALGGALELALLDATTAAPARADFPRGCAVSLFDAQGNRAGSAVLAAWRAAGFEAIGTGTRNHFAALNRARPAVNDAHQFTTFGIDAQVHAFDDSSMLETISQHAVVARQAAEMGGGRPVAIAPIVLGPGRTAADARLHTEFGARWALESILQLASARCVDRVTYFQLHGPDGILRENRAPTPLEHLFATRFEHPLPSVS